MTFENKNDKANDKFGSNNGSLGKGFFKENGTKSSPANNGFFGEKSDMISGNANSSSQSNTSPKNDATQQKSFGSTSVPVATNVAQNQATAKINSVSKNAKTNINNNISSLKRIRGKISQYRTYSDKSGNYRRLFPRKVYQAIIYGQRFEDFLHSFTLTEMQGVDGAGNPIIQKYVVNVHGSTNYGATLLDNEEVEVKGKFTSDNILMAKEIHVINGSVSTPIRFQRSVKMIVIFTLVAIGLTVLLCGLLTGGSSSVLSIMSTIKGFLATMLTTYGTLLIIYFISLLTKSRLIARLLSGLGRHGSPFVSMLIIAFILSILSYNVFGIGTVVGNVFSRAIGAIAPIAITIIIVLLLFKAFK